MTANLVIRSRADSPELRKAAASVEHAAWSDLGFLNYTRAHYEHYSDLLDAYPEYQLCLVDEDTGYPVAVANSVPIVCSGPADLPPEGWDWLVETAARAKNARPNMLGALAVSVPAVHRSKGYARKMIGSLLELAERKKLDGVVVAVRPSAKVKHPWVSLSEYITWTDPSGRMYDPWLRSHLA
ncbi:MAG: transferase, partial [Methyloceanibacter sp.]